MVNNLHVVMNSCAFASRVLKETSSLIRSGVVVHVYIIALDAEGLSPHEKIDGARDIFRLSLWTRKWPQNLLFQAFKYFEFCLRSILFARGKSIKVVNVHCLALLPLGVLLKWIYQAKLVYDAHELETELYGMSEFRKFLSKIIERTLIRFSDLVIVVGDEINKWYRTQYQLNRVITVLNAPEYQRIGKTQQLHEDLSITPHKKIIIYQGFLCAGRGIEKLLKVFSELSDEAYALVLMGYGPLETLIKSYSQFGSHIYLKKAVPPEKVISYTASADIGIAFIDNTSLNDRFCLPNKLFEYIMGNLPVIVNDAPEMKRLVQENKIGIVLNDLTKDSLRVALKSIADEDQHQVSKNLQAVAESFSWNNQALRMITAYREFVCPS